MLKLGVEFNRDFDISSEQFIANYEATLLLIKNVKVNSTGSHRWDLYNWHKKTDIPTVRSM